LLIWTKLIFNSSTQSAEGTQEPVTLLWTNLVCSVCDGRATSWCLGYHSEGQGSWKFSC